MTDREQRKPPADPSGLALRYTHEHHWDDIGDTAETWYVSADVPDAEDGDGQPIASHVGDVEIVLFDPNDPHAFDILDGEDADLGTIAGTVLNLSEGGLDPDLDAHLEPFGDRLLILNRVQLTPEWRGFGIGTLLAGLAIQRLAGGCRAAICYPAPLDTADEDRPEQDEVLHKAATAKLADVWSQLGFEHFRDGVYVLDLALVTLNQAIDRLRERLARDL